jgi:hypothetical protein
MTSDEIEKKIIIKKNMTTFDINIKW